MPYANGRLHLAAAACLCLTVAGCASMETFFADLLPDEQEATASEQEALLAAGPRARSTVPAGIGPFDRGKVHFQSGRYGMALEDFRTALDNDPRSVRTLNAIAASYDHLRRFDLAEKYYRRAMAVDPASAQTLNNMAYSYMMRSEWVRDERHLARAEDLLRRAEAAAPGNATVLGNLQLVAERRGRQAEPEASTHLASRLPAGVAVIRHDPYAGWVERRNESSYYLVTRPDPDVAARLRAIEADPGLVAVEHARLPRLVALLPQP